MARTIEKLSPLKVQRAKQPGLYHDGAGLYLHVGEGHGRSWLFRFMLNGRAREMGLGSCNTFSLAEARELARDARKMLHAGVDPIEAHHAARDARRIEAAKAISFRACAQKYIDSHKASWRNAKHGQQWENTLATFVYPIIGNLPVAAVDVGHVTRILEPIWETKTETAGRVRARIEVVLDYAATKRWRQGENPARWRGHLENVLPKKSKVARVRHHAAMSWGEVAAFMATLAAEAGVGALALRFAVITAARTGEVIGARWEEIDTKSATWTVPAERMKSGREHRVPLSEDALAVLRDAAKLGDGDFVFPGGKAGRHLPERAMLTLLERMGRDETVHGFRSTFRDWAGESGKAADIAEAALAHVVGDRTVAAYQRGDLLERRRRLMSDWAAHCGGRSSVTVLRGGRKRAP